MKQWMRKIFCSALVAAVLSGGLSVFGLPGATSALAQCSGGTACGKVTNMPGTPDPSQWKTADQLRDACIASLADMATVMLKASMANSTALSANGRNNEVITAADIKANAASVAACAKFGTDYYNWSTYGSADVSYTTEPAKSLQQQWRFKPAPVIPTATQFMNFYPTDSFMTWCPSPAQSGPPVDIGNGPKRMINPVDHLPVCVQPTAPMFSIPANMMEYASGCARDFEPDAKIRYQEEAQCMLQALANRPKAISSGAPIGTSNVATPAIGVIAAPAASQPAPPPPRKK